MDGCSNCAKRRDLEKECPWGGTYHHRGEHGEKIGICNAYKRETNADRIRAMSDKELARFLCNFRSDTEGGYPCNKCVAAEYCRPGHTGMIDWLQEQRRADRGSK